MSRAPFWPWRNSKEPSQPAEQPFARWSPRDFAFATSLPIVALALLVWVVTSSMQSNAEGPEPSEQTSWLSGVRSATENTARQVVLDLRFDRRQERQEKREERQERQAAREAARLRAVATRQLEETCERQDGEARPLQQVEEDTVVIRCEVRPFVALGGWSGGDVDVHVWSRWWRIGRIPARLGARHFSRSSPARVPSPPPPPAPVEPAPPAPAAPAPAAPQGPPGYPYTGNNGYTGPRCYAPGGVWWKPC